MLVKSEQAEQRHNNPVFFFLQIPEQVITKKPCKNSDCYDLARSLRLNQHASTGPAEYLL